MPTPYLKSLNKRGKGSMKSLEKKWDKTKDLADDQDQGDNYAYRTGILKRMVGAEVEDVTKALEQGPTQEEATVTQLRAVSRLLSTTETNQQVIMAIRTRKTKLKAASRLLANLMTQVTAKSKFKAGDYVTIGIPYSAQGRDVPQGQTGIVVGQPKWSAYSNQYMVDVKTRYDTSPFKEEHLTMEA